MNAHFVVMALTGWVALLLALCVHEFSHAAVARWLGDTTAEDEGRLTLNPLAHADPIGTVALPLAAAFLSMPVMIGWAKPVPFRPAAFRVGWFGIGHVLVAAGGPFSNLLQALCWAAVHLGLSHAVPLYSIVHSPLSVFALFVETSVVVNLVLAAFNALPVPPLDGATIASWGLPRRLGDRYDAFVERWGIWLLVAAMIPVFKGVSVIGVVLFPALLAADVLVGRLGGWPITMREHWAMLASQG